MNDKPYVRKIILTAIVASIMLLLILIPSSPVYGWLNKGRYQSLGMHEWEALDTATGIKIPIYSLPNAQAMPAEQQRREQHGHEAGGHFDGGHGGAVNQPNQERKQHGHEAGGHLDDGHGGAVNQPTEKGKHHE